MGAQEGCTSLRGLKRPVVPVICQEGGKPLPSQAGSSYTGSRGVKLFLFFKF